MVPAGADLPRCTVQRGSDGRGPRVGTRERALPSQPALPLPSLHGRASWHGWHAALHGVRNVARRCMQCTSHSAVGRSGGDAPTRRGRPLRCTPGLFRLGADPGHSLERMLRPFARVQALAQPGCSPRLARAHAQASRSGAYPGTARVHTQAQARGGGTRASPRPVRAAARCAAAGSRRALAGSRGCASALGTRASQARPSGRPHT